MKFEISKFTEVHFTIHKLLLLKDCFTRLTTDTDNRQLTTDNEGKLTVFKL